MPLVTSQWELINSVSNSKSDVVCYSSLMLLVGGSGGFLRNPADRQQGSLRVFLHFFVVVCCSCLSTSVSLVPSNKTGTKRPNSLTPAFYFEAATSCLESCSGFSFSKPFSGKMGLFSFIIQYFRITVGSSFGLRD